MDVQRKYEVPKVVGIASDFWNGWIDAEIELGQAWRTAVILLHRYGAKGKQRVRYLMHDGSFRTATVTARQL